MESPSTAAHDGDRRLIPHEHEELLGAARRERERVRRLRLLAKQGPQPQG